jgi:hypothetical protein
MPVQTRSQTRALAQVPVPTPTPTPTPTPSPTLTSTPAHTSISICTNLRKRVEKDIYAIRAFAAEMTGRLSHVSNIDLELTQTSLFDDKCRILKFLKLQTIDRMFCFIISQLPKIYTNRIHGIFLKTLSEKIAEFKIDLNSKYNVKTMNERCVVEHFNETLRNCEVMVTHIKTLYV